MSDTLMQLNEMAQQQFMSTSPLFIGTSTKRNSITPNTTGLPGNGGSQYNFEHNINTIYGRYDNWHEQCELSIFLHLTFAFV
ncbi:hypothetical protein KIN20_007490 [Parelaphostrongylus tenuis]|uniref:Uncharacterized protein n=1 Tax=Parelaphostrongylus tenuis TaxID=148309 RepID=A0AAD5M3I0_PARTN|nr:hypothetical protein KIN20_007490 [Parelaphostrongylus tenuis]